MEGYSPNNPSVKRILREIKEMEKDTSSDYFARAVEDNIFEWHFTIRGPSGTPFEGGVYHGRILLPPEYPFKPPNIVWLTPNGRFDVGTKICLTISAHHPEHWQPSWSIRTALVALIGFLPTPGEGALGALDYSADERRVLAKKSVNFCCPKCGPIAKILPPVPIDNEATTATQATIDPPEAERDERRENPQQQQQAEVQNFGVVMGGEGGVLERVAGEQARAPPLHQENQQDHEIEGPAKLLNYVIIALFFAIVAVVMRKFAN